MGRPFYMRRIKESHGKSNESTMLPQILLKQS